MLQKSSVRKYFKRSIDDNTVKCQLCEVSLTNGGGTTNMLHHTRTKHPAEEKLNAKSKTDNQTTITSFVNSPRKADLARGRKLVGHFKHSTTLNAEMRKLIQDVTTRWNSTQLMLKRLVEQRRVLNDIMVDPSCTKKQDMDCNDDEPKPKRQRRPSAIDFLIHESPEKSEMDNDEHNSYLAKKPQPRDIYFTVEVRFLDQDDHNIIYGQEGKTMNISCATITGYDVKNIYIYENRNILAESNSNMVTFSIKPSRQHHSNWYLCCYGVTDAKYTEWVYVNLQVNYAPDVKVLFKVNRIDCVPDGLPDTYTFDRWEHQSEQGEHIRFLNGLENGTLILQTLPQQYQISGRYICTVSNGIPDMNGSILQTNFTSYNYQGPPIFVHDNRNVQFVDLFKPTTMTFLIYSNPVVEEIWIEGVAPYYTKNETILDFRISETELLYSEFGNKGHIKGNEIAFEFKMFSNDYEMYKIWTKNGLGEESFSFNIRAIGSPIFVHENSNVKSVELYKPLTLTFLISSYPIVEEIWIEGVASSYTKNETIHEFRISEKRELLYSEIGNKENIKGYEFAFEIKMFSNEYEMYKIWTKKRLGEDSFSFSIQAVGAPIFLRENRNVMHGELGEHLTLTFLLYSDPLLDDIWIQSVGTDCNQNRTKHEFRMSNTTLSYTAFGNRGNIKGYEIEIDTYIENSNDFRVYHICAKNELGLDFFIFEIEPSESGENNKKDRIGLITSSIFSAGLLVYITVLHICLFVRHRMKRTRRGHIQEPLHYNIYDEIGSISYEAVNIRRLDSNQQEPMLPARIISSPQNESITTTINYRAAMTVSTPSRVSLQESIVNAARRSYNAVTAIDTSFPLAIEEIRHSDRSYNEDSFASSDNSLQSFQRRSHQDENSSNSKRTSTSSSTSDGSRVEANATTTMGLNLNFGDGYENPYQIVVHENQGTHQYSSIINPNAAVDSARPTSDIDVQTTNVTDYVNLRF
ncbi:unnamed protein product [Mytilus coruscus]|uniref:BED-type domain-containing protein n=1 Tax=Mytilus coruscus TaxID=42192 RepID=A0A6J8ERX1_MYTCO|nr:unnamed protein product [Mytilus coruscus]